MVSLISLNEDVFTLIFDQINLPTLINLNCVCSTLKNLTTEKLQNKYGLFVNFWKQLIPGKKTFINYFIKN